MDEEIKTTEDISVVGSPEESEKDERTEGAATEALSTAEELSGGAESSASDSADVGLSLPAENEDPEAAARAAAEAEEKARKRREEIQAYIDSLADKEVYDPDSYEVHLENFDGPLDLLWFLIRRSKIDISEIFVSEITEQYLAEMSQIDRLDLERAADFIEVAACLIEIKSKALLPRPPVIEDPEDDPERTLIRRLEEYRIFKEASQKMKEIETTGLHYRDPDPSVGKPRLVLGDMTLDGLIEALKKMVVRLDVKAKANRERNIIKDRFTVAEKVRSIREYYEDADTVTFTELFEDDYTKSEVITTFQAMLELLKDRFFRAEQKEIFGEILLHRTREEVSDDDR